MSLEASSRLKRLGWLALIWLSGVLALGAVALVLRVLMSLAGMKPS